MASRRPQPFARAGYSRDHLEERIAVDYPRVGRHCSPEALTNSMRNALLLLVLASSILRSLSGASPCTRR